VAKDHLFITDGDHGQYRLQWYIAEYDDYGSIVGEGSPPEFVERDSDDEDALVNWECWKSHEVAAKSKGVQKDSGGFYWESKSLAQAALKLINAELKADRPLPEWAKTAIANGWKAPKGWKP